MAKLTALPSLAIIDGFKGTVDFYIHRGIPCARSWPRAPSMPRSPAVQEQWADFIIASRAWSLLDQETQDAYNAQAAGTHFSGRDLFSKSYLAGIYT